MIAAGGLGVTYEAEDVKLHTRVALKEYYPADFGELRPKSGSYRTDDDVVRRSVTVHEVRRVH